MGKMLYFIWKNEDCRSKGIKLQSPVPIIRPEERVEHVEIPGRSGDLTETQGEEIYNSYIQTAQIAVPGWLNIRGIYSWLRGSGYVTFHGEPDRRQAARIIGAITLTKHSRNLDWWEGECQFYCQPLKELLYPKTTTITSSGTTVVNTGDVTSKPFITAKASGTSMMVAAGGRSLVIHNTTSSTEYMIDCDTMEVYYRESQDTILKTKDTSGKFPVLLPGENTITGSGWSSLVIDKRERFL